MRILLNDWRIATVACLALVVVGGKTTILWHLAPTADTLFSDVADEIGREGVDYNAIVASVKQKSASVADEFHSTSNEVISKSAKIFNDDPTMQEALRIARNSLPKFNSAFVNHRNGRFSVRAVFSSHDKEEALWVRLVGLKGNDYYGELVDQPKILSELEVGQPVHLKSEDVVDWLIQQGDVLFGAYTTRVMLARLNTPASLKALEAIRDL